MGDRTREGFIPPLPPGDAPGDSVKSPNMQTLHWWILYHRFFFDKMIIATGKKLFYYGGYAISQHFGFVKDREIPGMNIGKEGNNLTSYLKGSKTLKEDVSDIDAKLLGVSVDEECDLAERILYALALPPTMTHYHTVADRVTRGGPYAMVAYGDMLKGSGLAQIIAHNYKYQAHPPKCQIIITGIFPDKKVQTLAEISFSDEAAPTPPAGIPEHLAWYGMYSIKTLCLQFIQQFRNLKDRAKRDEKTRKRILKTLRRILFCIVHQMLKRIPISEEQWSFLPEMYMDMYANTGGKYYRDYIKEVLGEDLYLVISDFIHIIYIIQKIREKKEIAKEDIRLSKCIRSYGSYIKLLEGVKEEERNALEEVMSSDKCDKASRKSRSRSSSSRSGSKRSGSRRNSRTRTPKQEA